MDTDKPTVTLNEGPTTPPAPASPAQRPGLTYVTDSAGRKFGVRKLSALDKMRIFRAVGGENSENNRYLGMAIIAASVAEIDGQPEPKPQTLRQIEAMVELIDDHGIAAIAQAMQEIYGDPEPEIALAKK